MADAVWSRPDASPPRAGWSSWCVAAASIATRRRCALA